MAVCITRNAGPEPGGHGALRPRCGDRFHGPLSRRTASRHRSHRPVPQAMAAARTAGSGFLDRATGYGRGLGDEWFRRSRVGGAHGWFRGNPRAQRRRGRGFSRDCGHPSRGEKKRLRRAVLPFPARLNPCVRPSIRRSWSPTTGFGGRSRWPYRRRPTVVWVARAMWIISPSRPELARR